jgi:DNA-binding transcriptional MerR regulator
LRIGELAKRANVSAKAIRFYESSGLLPDPPRTPSGYRQYRDDDLERLLFIKSAQRFGLTLDEISEVIAFRERGEPPCEYVVEVVKREIADLDGRIRELRSLRRELIALVDRAQQTAGNGKGYCRLLSHQTSAEELS